MRRRLGSFCRKLPAYLADFLNFLPDIPDTKDMKLWAGVRTIHVSLGIIAMIFIAMAPTRARAEAFETQSSQEVLADGLDAEKRGELTHAEALYRQASILPDTQENGTVSLARVLVRELRVEEARKILKEYVKDLNPFSVDAHIELADIYLDAEDLKNAEAELNTINKLHPGYEPLHERLGIMAFRSGNFEKSVKEMSRVIEQQPTHLKAISLRYQAYLKLGQSLDAAKDVQRLMEIAPGIAEHYRALADIYMGSRDYPQVEDTIQKGLADRGFARAESEKMLIFAALAYEQLADVYTRAGNYPRATAVLKDALALRTIPTIERSKLLFAAGDLMEREQKFDRAEKFYSRAFQANQGSLDAALKYADLLVKRNAFDRGALMLRKILVIQPNHEEAAQKLVALYNKAQRKDKLGVFLRDYVDAHPERVWAMVAYVKLLGSIGDLKAAENALIRATSEEHSSPELYLLYAKVLDQQKRYDDAKNILSEGVQHYPKDARLRFDLALIYEHAGSVRMAEQAYNAVPISDPDLYYQAQVNIALIFEKLGDANRAMGTLLILEDKFGKNEEVSAKVEELKLKIRGPGNEDRSVASEGEHK